MAALIKVRLNPKSIGVVQLGSKVIKVRLNPRSVGVVRLPQ